MFFKCRHIANASTLCQPTMNQFLQLNRHKLKFAFKVISLLFVTLISIAFILAVVNGHVPDYGLIAIVFLTAGIAFPCFIIFISYLAWYYKQWAKRRAFSTQPFNQLYMLGFTDRLQGERTKWAFTQEVKAGTINGFDLIADILYDNRQIITVRAFTAWRQIDKIEYRRLSKEFSAYDIEFDTGCFVKKYNTKRMSHLSINNLKSDLEEFTSLLRRNGFEPETQQGWA